MKTFISAADIEELAGQGVHELTVDEDTVLTALARETAGQLGVKLVAPGLNKPGFSDGATKPGFSEKPGLSLGANPGLSLGANPGSGKPRGCQHGPVGAGSPRPSTAAGTSPVVDELIGAVKQMARK